MTLHLENEGEEIVAFTEFEAEDNSIGKEMEEDFSDEFIVMEKQFEEEFLQDNAEQICVELHGKKLEIVIPKVQTFSQSIRMVILENYNNQR